MSRKRRAGFIFPGILLILALAYGIARMLARPTPAADWSAPRPGDHKPLVLAHQGGENLWPSNTRRALEQSAALGADVLDMDMHMTRDGVLVLMHDRTVDRTTNGSGAIRDLTLAEIKQLDAGYRFTPDNGQTYPYRGKGLAVPTLEELFQAFPGKRFGIEIKDGDPVSMAQAFCALIRKYGMEKSVLVSSFSEEQMDPFRRECPEVATSATTWEVRTFYIFFRLGLVDTLAPRYASLQVPEESGGIYLLTQKFVNAAHRRGLTVIPWTINEEDDLRRILALGVDGINTDNPDRLLDMLK
jgi:glycerophosphoryl diester phosphodiesterase